jgi:hypothetical protein
MVHVTIVGRFFSGDRHQGPNGKTWWGDYGHFGLSTLLVIQQVLAVEPIRANK